MGKIAKLHINKRIASDFLLGRDIRKREINKLASMPKGVIIRDISKIILLLLLSRSAPPKLIIKGTEITDTRNGIHGHNAKTPLLSLS